MANTVKRQSAEIAALKTELKGKPVAIPPKAVSIPSASLKRKAACPSPSPALPQADGFVFVKKPKFTLPSQDSNPDTQSLAASKDTPTPTRRDKFTRAERKLLPGYSTPDSEGFYKAFADTYEEQELKNKVSEHRYEYPPAKVPSSFYKLDI